MWEKLKRWLAARGVFGRRNAMDTELLISVARGSRDAIAAEKRDGTITRQYAGAQRVRRHQSPFETGPYGFVQLGLDGRLLDANLALAYMLGFDDCAQLLSLSAADLFSRPAHCEELIAACFRGERLRREVEWKRKDGTPIAVRLLARRADNEAQPAIEAIAEDLTVQRKLQRLRKNELLGQLAGQIVHDLRNCLTIIAGHEDMLSLSAGDDATLCSHASAIHQAVERAAELASRLQVLGGTGSQHLERVDLNLTVTQSLSMLREVLRRDLSLAADLVPCSLCVYADGVELKQALLNLVINARDAMTGAGSIEVRTKRVRIPVSETEKHGRPMYESYAVLTVADTGRGMDEPTRLHSADAFYSTNSHGAAAGLGLASVHAIVRRFGGWLDIQSAEGQGAAISLYIPACRSEAGLEAEETQASGVNLKPERTVLVVDGKPLLNETIDQMLTEFDFCVIRVADWNDAMATIRNVRVDLLICSLEPPDISTSELSEKLCWLHRTMKVIVLSGRALSKEEQHSFSPAILLQPPFSTPELLATIHAQVGFGPQ